MGFGRNGSLRCSVCAGLQNTETGYRDSRMCREGRGESVGKPGANLVSCDVAISIFLDFVFSYIEL